MNRRGFLGMLVGGVAVTAAERTWPFRVFSFPSKPTALNLEGYSYEYHFRTTLPQMATIYYDKKALDNLKDGLLFEYVKQGVPWINRLKP